MAGFAEPDARRWFGCPHAIEFPLIQMHVHALFLFNIAEPENQLDRVDMSFENAAEAQVGATDKTQPVEQVAFRARVVLSYIVGEPGMETMRCKRL